MAINNKIKGMLRVSGKSQAELAKFMGISAQSLSNKMSRGYFTSDDLIRIALFCSCKLSYSFSDGSEIIFTAQDLHDTSSDS
jgi:DNA-binding XRE family transcriptional regulator